MKEKLTDGEPPKDGKEYLAFGNIGYTADGCCRCVEPFVAIIHFDGRLWLDRRGLSITQTLEDTLHFHNHVAVGAIGDDLASRTVELFQTEMAESHYAHDLEP